MTPEKFNEIEKLYHYTSFEKGLLIILSRTMIMSHPSKMNDINESYRPLYCNYGNDIEEVEKELKKYYQSSFTLKDGKTPGFFIPAMWGHYANKGEGICIVFDRKKLISRFEQYGFFHDAVIYHEDYNSSILIEGEPKKFIRENIKKIFFSKSKDWEYEREYRVVCRSEKTPVEFDLTDCILAVIVHKFDDTKDVNLNQSAIYKSIVRRLKVINIPVLSLDWSSLDMQYELKDYETMPETIYWEQK